MIHHVSVGTNDLKRSKRFDDAVLPIVGILPLSEDEGGLGYASGTFHFSVQVPIDGQAATVGNGSHIAFAAEDRAMVDRFHAAALDQGGKDDGEPGLRPSYNAGQERSASHQIALINYLPGLMASGMRAGR